MTAPDLTPVIPEIILVVTACLILVVEPFLKLDKTASVAIALTGLLAAGVVAVGLSGREIVSFAGMIVLNDFTVFFKVLFAVAGILTILMSPRYLEAQNRHLGEYYALLILAIIGMNLMVASRNLMAFYVGLELMAMSSYVLAGFFRFSTRSNEAALKYFVTGAFASAITLYGVSLVYGLAGTTNYGGVAEAMAGGGNELGLAFAMALVFCGMGFKVSVAPFHMWTPDVYEGAPTPIAGFFSVGPKAAGFAALLVIFLSVFAEAVDTWRILFVAFSLFTMFVGNVFALVQRNVKRMLAYSSIAHVGYLLAGIAALGQDLGEVLAGQAILLYLAAYTFMNLGAFGVLAYLKTQDPVRFDYSLTDLAGMGRRSPWAAILMSLFMFSLTGIPGTAGFIGKFYLFTAVVQADMVWLAVIAVLFSAVSAYYYLRVIMYMFFREPVEEFVTREGIGGPLAASLGLSAAGVLAIGLVPVQLWDAAVSAFQNFLG